MGSLTGSGDLPDYYNDKDDLTLNSELNDLLSYPFRAKEELGNVLSKYMGGKRVDVTKLKSRNIVKSPIKFLTVVKVLEKEASTIPSYGLEIIKGSRKDYIHFLLELNEHASVGVFFYDTKRMLSVPQIHKVERLIKTTGLKGGIIVANNIGIPAKQEAVRINKEHEGHGILTIEHYASLKKRLDD